MGRTFRDASQSNGSRVIDARTKFELLCVCVNRGPPRPYLDMSMAVVLLYLWLARSTVQLARQAEIAPRPRMHGADGYSPELLALQLVVLLALHRLAKHLMAWAAATMATTGGGGRIRLVLRYSPQEPKYSGRASQTRGSSRCRFSTRESWTRQLNVDIESNTKSALNLTKPIGKHTSQNKRPCVSANH